MADKTINELVEASQILPQDLFVLQQENAAKKLSGQTLVNYLLKMIDGHGGVSSYGKVATEGLIDTYRLTFADESTLDIPVANGRAITSIQQTKIEGLIRTYTIQFNDKTSIEFVVADGRSVESVTKTASVDLEDTYTINYNDGTTSTFTVTNGSKGEKGDNTYTWIKYASQKPTETSHDFGDIADNWIGIYAGSEAEAPVDWKQYTWFEIKGKQGDTGAPATLISVEVEYQVSDSGTIVPYGNWATSVPVVAQGKFLWTRTTQTFNTGVPVVAYSVSRMGIDGAGSVSSVAGVSPDSNGNVPLSAQDLGALPSSGGAMTGPINMNGLAIQNVADPVENGDAASKGFVNAAVRKAAPRNLLDNSNFRNPMNQRARTIYTGTGGKVYTIDRWLTWSTNTISIVNGGISVGANSVGGTGHLQQYLPLSHIDVNKVYTAAFENVDGNIHCVSGKFSDGFGDVAANNVYCYVGTDVAIFQLHTGIYKWAALYEGEYTAGTLPEYQPKGYAEEWLECRRYYKSYNPYDVSFVASLTNGIAYISVNFPENPMRTDDLSYEGSGAFYISSDVYTGNSQEDVVIHKSSKNSVTLKITVPTNSTATATCEKVTSRFAISADL